MSYGGVVCVWAAVLHWRLSLLLFPMHLKVFICPVLQAVSTGLIFLQLHNNSLHSYKLNVRTCTFVNASEKKKGGNTLCQWNMEPFAVKPGCYLLSRLMQQLLLLYLICLGYVPAFPGPSEDVKSILMLLELQMQCECSPVSPAQR